MFRCVVVISSGDIVWADRGLFNSALEAAALLISEGLKTIVFVTRPIRLKIQPAAEG